MPGTITAWSGYAKDRFDEAAKRVDEFRNWARQLAGAVAVVIGFELTLVGRILDLKEPFDHQLQSWALRVLVVTLTFQIVLLLWILRTGYTGRRILGPESPTILASYIAEADETETNRILGAYYARAYDEFHAAGEALAKSVSQLTVLFTGSLLLLLIGIGLLVQLATAGAYTGSMTKPTASPATPATPATAAPASSATPQSAASSASTAPASPILTTPTSGQIGTFSATPTAGQLTSRTAAPTIPASPSAPTKK